MPQTHIHPQHQLLQVLFDLLMAQIEPDLTSNGIRDIDARSADESPEERAARFDRYAVALATVDRQMNDLLGMWTGEILAEKKTMLGKMQTKSRAEDRQHLSDIDAQIDDA